MMDDALRALVLGEAAMASLTGAARYRNEPDAVMWDPIPWEYTPTGVPPTISVYPWQHVDLVAQLG